MEVTLNPAKAREEEVTVVAVKLITSNTKEFVQIVGRSATSGQLLTAQCSKKALGVKNLTRGASVLLVGEARIANVTSYKDETGGIKAHETTAFHVANIIDLSEENDLDFDKLFAVSTEPEA